MNLSLWRIPEFFELQDLGEVIEKALAESARQTRFHKYADDDMDDWNMKQAKDQFDDAIFMAAMFRQMRKRILLQVDVTHFPRQSANDQSFDIPGGAA